MPPYSPASNDGYRCETTKPPREFLELSAQLALECFHARYSQYSEDLPKAVIAEYIQNLAEEELSYDELLVLSIFVWDVNASIPVLLLRHRNQPADSATALSELDRKQLSESFSLDMINANSNSLSGQYNAILGIVLQEDVFRCKIVGLIESLDYSFITFLLVLVSRRLIRYWS
jgi:hypothetical protein